MINKKTKSFGVVLLSILMIFSLVIFTACEPLDPADPPSNPPANIYTKENAITVLTNASTLMKQSAPQTSPIEIGVEPMTEYKGIDGWKVNSVDFVHKGGGYSDRNSIARHCDMFKEILDENLININEDYRAFDARNSIEFDRQQYVYLKSKFEDNKMVLFIRMYKNGYGSSVSSSIVPVVTRYLITFNNELEVKNVVKEEKSFIRDTYHESWGLDVFYYANSTCYWTATSFETTDDITEVGAIYAQLFNSLNAELLANVKQSNEYPDIDEYVNYLI